MLGNFSCFLSFADFFSKSNFTEYHQSVKQFVYPGQARHFVWSEGCPNCLPRISAGDTGKRKVRLVFYINKLSEFSDKTLPPKSKYSHY